MSRITALPCLQEMQYRISLQEWETHLRTTIEWMSKRRQERERTSASLKDTGRPNSEVTASVAALPKTRKYICVIQQSVTWSFLFCSSKEGSHGVGNGQMESRRRTRTELHYGSCLPLSSPVCFAQPMPLFPIAHTNSMEQSPSWEAKMS